MSGPARPARSSGAARLVARAHRPAVRPRAEYAGFQVVELPEAAAPPGLPARTPEHRGSRPGVPPPPAPVEPVLRPPLESATRHSAAETFAKPGPTGPPTPAVSTERQQTRPTPGPARAEPPQDRPSGRTVPETPVERRREAPPPVEAPDADAKGEAPGWQVLARAEPAELPVPESAASPAPPPRTAPGEPDERRERTAPSTARAATAPGRAEQRVSAAVGAPEEPSRSPSATEQQGSAPSAQPPQVLIDRIEVITPPARAAEPDPFASLAPRRVGASRHGGRG